MKGLYTELTQLAKRHGTKGIILLILLHYGAYSFLVNLVGLIIDPPPFVNTWGVLILACGMVAFDLKMIGQKQISKTDHDNAL